MDSKKFLIRLVPLIFFIFLLNYLAMKFYWYSSVWYLDMPMHFLGGVWLGLAVILFFKIKEISFILILKIILGVLFIGILWEFFEVIVNDYTTQNYFNLLDTLSDLSFDISGGMFAIIYFFKKFFPIKKDIIFSNEETL